MRGINKHSTTTVNHLTNMSAKVVFEQMIADTNQHEVIVKLIKTNPGLVASLARDDAFTDMVAANAIVSSTLDPEKDVVRVIVWSEDFDATRSVDVSMKNFPRLFWDYFQEEHGRMRDGRNGGSDDERNGILTLTLTDPTDAHDWIQELSSDTYDDLSAEEREAVDEITSVTSNVMDDEDVCSSVAEAVEEWSNNFLSHPEDTVAEMKANDQAFLKLARPAKVVITVYQQ